MLSLEVILELSHVLQLGGSFIEAIKKKFLLLGQVEGLDTETLERDLTSNSIKLEKTVIAVVSILVKDTDMDRVVCYLCGNCPKIVSTDGNTKVIQIKALYCTIHLYVLNFRIVLKSGRI